MSVKTISSILLVQRLVKISKRTQKFLSSFTIISILNLNSLCHTGTSGDTVLSFFKNHQETKGNYFCAIFFLYFFSFFFLFFFPLALLLPFSPQNCWKCFGCHSLSSPLPLDNYRILTLSPPSSLSSPDSPPPSLEYLWLLPSQHLSPFLSSSSSSSSPPFVPRCLLCSSRMTSLRTPLGNPPLNRPKSIIKAE